MDTLEKAAPRGGAAPLAGARILHTKHRVHDLEKSLAFYTGLLRMKLLLKKHSPDGNYTLALVA